MPGGGSGNGPIFVKESDFDSLPGSPTYYKPGRNLTADDVSVRNALERLTLPDDSESVESLAGRFESGLEVSWAMSSDRASDIQDIVWNSSGSFDGSSAANTSAWYVGLDHLTGKAERQIGGAFPTEYSLTYSGDSNTVTESLTLVGSNETKNTSFTPSSVQDTSDGNTIPFHGAKLDIDSTTITALQSFTLTISNIAQPITGPQREPIDAVIARPETTLDFTATMHKGPQSLDYTYGSSGSSSNQDSVSGVSGTITISDSSGSTVATYSLSNVTPDEGSWENVTSDEPTDESVSAHVNGVSVS